MIYILYLLVILVLIVDLIFYVPICIHIYQDNSNILLYFYAIPLMHIDNKKHINIFKNKLSIDKLLSINKKQIKVIESIKVSKINVSINKEFALCYPYIFYPMLDLININENYKYKIDNHNKLYIQIKFNVSNLLSKLLSKVK